MTLLPTLSTKIPQEFKTMSCRNAIYERPAVFEDNHDWLWLGDKEEADRDKSKTGFWFIRSDPRRRPTYPSDLSNLSDFASMHRKYFKSPVSEKSTNEYSQFVQKIMPTTACSVSIPGSAASIQELSQRQRFMLIFKFTVAAVIRLSEHYIRLIRDILNGRGGLMYPGGLYPKMDAFLRNSPIRYVVIYHLCQLNMAADELFGAYELYHFRSDYRRSDGRVCIDEGNGSSFYNELEYYMCGIFGFQGYAPNGETDPYMKPNIEAPLFGVEPGSKVHVDYILNRRGEYNKALIAVFGIEFCSKFFDPMKPVRDHWSEVAKQMQSMGDQDSEVYCENDEDGFALFSDDAGDELQQDDGGDSSNICSSDFYDDDDYDDDDEEEEEEDDDDDDDEEEDDDDDDEQIPVEK